MAIELGVLNWQHGTVFHAAKRCFNDWLATSGGGNPEERAALEQIMYFIEANMQNFRGWHEKEASNDGRNIPKQVGYTNEDSDVYYIMPAIFKRDVCKGYAERFVLKLLQSRHALQCSDGRNQLKVRPMGAKKSIWVYAIKFAELENALGTVGTQGTNQEKENINNDLTCSQSVPTSFPNTQVFPVKKRLFSLLGTLKKIRKTTF